MDSRAAKLALARKKLKDHQEKKQIIVQNVDLCEEAGNDVNNRVLNQKEDNEFTVNEQVKITVNTNENTETQLVKSHLKDSLDMNVAELLISNKRNLEVQVTELQSKLADLDSKLKYEVQRHNDSKQKISNLESELHNIDVKYAYATKEMQQQNDKIKELNATKSTLLDKNTNLLDQLEFTKTILTTKETENASLHNHLDQVNRELEVSKLQLQQLLNGSNAYTFGGNNDPGSNRNEELLQKIDNLEQQLKSAQKEREQINMHYEHYVGELNEQLKMMISKNEELSKQIYHLANRESCLIDQISEMEIRIQNLQVKSLENSEKLRDDCIDVNALQNDYSAVQKRLQEVTQRYEQLRKLNEENESKVMELQKTIKFSCHHDDISVTKLTADITSDKVAAQRATEQNKILKTRMQELEEAFVKMSQDKLHLTEKITAEKFLNRELTIKLADSEDKCKDMHIKLMAKDEEMIRLQNNYRDMEKIYAEFSSKYKNKESSEDCTNEDSLDKEYNDSDEKVDETVKELADENNHIHESCIASKGIGRSHHSDIQKEDAMLKLQERFLKIMSEVADLSDEKHRLEHIILQLQNETDTICEYVALYQQQRSLLKKRDEERGAQIKLFQIECDRLKRELEELSGILLRFAEDKQLAIYFQEESRMKDMEKVRSLLFNLKSNSLVDPLRRDLELSKVYPCNCCSGNLIEV